MVLEVGRVVAEPTPHSQVAEEQPWVQVQRQGQHEGTAIVTPTLTNGKQMASQEAEEVASLSWEAKSETALKHGTRGELAAHLASDEGPHAVLEALSETSRHPPPTEQKLVLLAAAAKACLLDCSVAVACSLQRLSTAHTKAIPLLPTNLTRVMRPMKTLTTIQPASPTRALAQASMKSAV